MGTPETIRRILLGRDVAMAYAVVLALYLAQYVRFQPVQIPAYLLLVAYDLIEVGIPALTPYYPVGVALFLYLVAVVGAGTARWVGTNEGGVSDWLPAAGGVCLIVGSLSLLFGFVVGGPLVSPADNPTPLTITTATGVVFLAGGWYLLHQRDSDGSVETT